MGSAFLQEFRNWESAWALDALYVVAYEIRVLAERVKNEKLYPCFILPLSGFFKIRMFRRANCIFFSFKADRELASMGKIPEKLKGAGSFLMKVFGVLAVCLYACLFFC